MSIESPHPILVVDDEPFMQRVLTHQLRRLGHAQVHGAGGGREALAWLDAQPAPPALIVLDLHMPDLDGAAVVDALAERGYRGGLLLVSGDDAAALQAAVQAARARLPQVLGALNKPPRPEQLAERLRDWRPT